MAPVVLQRRHLPVDASGVDSASVYASLARGLLSGDSALLAEALTG